MIKNSGITNMVNWEIGEIQTLNNSIIQLTPKESAELFQLSSQQRKQEYKAIRVLKQFVFGSDEIIYGKNGKPELHHEGLFIGISHSKQWALFAHSLKAFGCDIEQPNERIHRVKDRFCSNDELELFAGEVGIIQLTQLWGCKEAIYKLINESGIHWKDQMRCTGISETNFTFTVETNKHFTVNCESFSLNNAIISIATYA